MNPDGKLLPYWLNNLAYNGFVTNTIGLLKRQINKMVVNYFFPDS